MIRRFMWAAFPMLINILFALSLIIAILGAVAMSFGWGGFSPWRLLISLVLGVSGIILLFGSICLLLDIRDSFRKKRGYLSSFATLKRAKEQSSKNSEITSDEETETRFSVQYRAVYEQGLAKKDAILGMHRQHVSPLLASWRVKLTAWVAQKRSVRQERKAADATARLASKSIPARVPPTLITSKVEAQPEHKPAQEAVQPAVVVPEAVALPDRKPAEKRKLVLAILAVLIVIIGVIMMLMSRNSENLEKPEIVTQKPTSKTMPPASAEKKVSPAPAESVEEKKPSTSPAPAKNAEKPKQPAPQGKKQRAPATNTDAKSSSQKPAENKREPKKDQPQNVFDLIKKIPKGEAPKSNPWD